MRQLSAVVFLALVGLLPAKAAAQEPIWVENAALYNIPNTLGEQSLQVHFGMYGVENAPYRVELWIDPEGSWFGSAVMKSFNFTCSPYGDYFGVLPAIGKLAGGDFVTAPDRLSILVVLTAPDGEQLSYDGPYWVYLDE